MNQVVPSSLLFDYRFQVPSCADPSRKKRGQLLTLPSAAELPVLSAMDNGSRFATICAGWNPKGLGITVGVRGRSQPVTGDARNLDRSDGIELWIDTRPTGNVHRATGYCHRLMCLASDDSAEGMPAAVPQSIPQQREIRAEMQAKHIQLRLHSCSDGYDLEIWIPDSQLYGFDQIDELRQLGFYCVVHDTELGEQALTVPDAFPFAWDPSLWVNLELTDE